MDQNQNDNLNPSTVETLIAWTAPSRPFRKRDRSYFSSIAVIVVLLVLISLLIQEPLLAGAMIALAFLAYVLNLIPPDNVEFKISTQGVTSGEHFYHWNSLDNFWITGIETERILHIKTLMRFPGELILTLGDQDEDKIKKTIAKYLPFQEIPPKGLLDNWSLWLQKQFPLENSSKK